MMIENTNIGHYSIPSFLDSTLKITINTTLLYFVFAKLSRLIFVPEINLPPFFPAIGFAVAAVMIFGRKAIYGVAIGSFLFSIGLFRADFQNAANFEELSKPLFFCLTRPLIAVLNALLVSYMTQLWCKNKYPFSKGIHVIYFSISCLLGSLISVSVGIIPLVITSHVPLENLLLMWSNWIRGNTLGAILFTPFVLSWLYKTEEITKWSISKKVEGLVLFFITVAISIYIFETRANNESIIIFVLIWAAYRFGIKAISLASLTVTIIAVYCTGHHMGGFIFSGWNNNFLMLQLFLFVNMVSIMFLRGILEENDNKKNKLKVNEKKLNLKKNILQATIESPTGISIFSLDNNYNYLSYNSAHKAYMKNEYGVEINIGDSYIEFIVDKTKKAIIIEQLNNVLNGNIHTYEEKDTVGEYWNISISPITNKQNSIIGTTTIVTNITALKSNEIQLEKNNYDLNQRIKELTCLYKVFEIINNKTISASDLIPTCVQMIPLGFQFPEITNCRILIHGQKHTVDKNQKTNWSLYKNITVNGSAYGVIEVGYLAEKKVSNAFVVEETQLLEAIADILSKSIENNLANEKLTKSEDNYRILFENVQDVFFKTSIKTKNILDVSPSCIHFNGVTREELIGRKMSSIYPDKEQMELMFQKTLTDQKVIDYNNEITIKGKLFYVSINAKVITDADGEPDFVVGSLRDITERKLAEKNLQTSEENYRTLFENVQDVFFKTSLRTNTILEVSPSCSNFNGIKREELIGQSIFAIYPDTLQLNQMNEKLALNGKIIDYNNEIIIKNQRYFVSINAKVIFDVEGKPEYLIGTLRDISERRLAEEKLKISEEKFRSIYENMLDVYYLQDLTGLILDVSPSIEKHLQLKKQDVIGKYVRDFYANQSQYDELKEIIHTKGFINDQEVCFVTPSGESSYFSVNGKVIFDVNGIPTHVEGSMRNIDERITNQQKLIVATEKIKESEEEFRSIFESFEDLYFRTSIDGIVQKVSPSIEKILKLKSEDVLNTDVNNLYFFPEARTKILNFIRLNGSVTDFETVLKDKEGNPVHMSLNATIVYDTKGNPTHTEGTLRDISERKKNEHEIELANEIIKESEKKYRTIFESVRDVFFRASAKDHKIIDISPSCSYFDVKPEEVIGRNILDFYYIHEDRQAVLQELIKNEEIKNYDIKMVINAKVYTVSVNSKIIYDQNNEPEYIIGSIHDITDRIEAEENLKISEEKFRSIYENFEDVYFRTALDGTVLDVSPSFEKHFHRPCSEALGSSVFDFYFDEKDRALLLEKMKEKGFVSDFDALFKDALGNVLYFSVNASFVYDANEIPVNIEGTMRNINERRMMQEEMLAKNKKLEFQNTELEQFAYIASHDLQEPLITVIHCAELLQEEMAEKLEEDQKQYLNFINSSTSRMQLLVKGLLEYSRIGKERKTDLIDCNEIVDNVLSDMNASVKESNALIEYENLPRIEGNATEMRQLFQNMISNAIKFRRKNSKPKVKITAVKEDENWLFSIADNGIGIEKENMDKVFVIFKRLNNRSDYQGTGIGLSHCKKIIEQHHGKIWVESKFNKGSTFKWTLPLN